MTFQVKDFRSIVLAMINHAKATQEKITDFHVGSVTRTLFEAPAVELDEFYQQVFRGLLDAIPVAVYRAFGHDLLEPAYASGFVRFTAPEGQKDKTVAIPIGFEIYRNDSDVKYVTQEEARLEPRKDYVDVRVTATTIGVVGNADIGALTLMESALDGIASISNPKPITGGRDNESESERKARFLEYIESLSRGTVKAIIYAAKLATVTNAAGEIIEYVTRVGIHEEPGYVDVYIYGSGGMPSNELLNTAQFIIDGGYDATTGTLVPGYRGGGISVEAIYGLNPWARLDELMDEYHVAVCCCEQLPNYDSAKQFAFRHVGRVFLVSNYTNIDDDMVRWGDANLSLSDRKTAEEYRDRYTLSVDQYKLMSWAMARITRNMTLFPASGELVQDIDVKGRMEKRPILRDMVWPHFVRTALVTETNEDEHKMKRKVVKVGLDPHFSFAYMLCCAAWCRAYGTATFLMPDTGGQERRGGVLDALLDSQTNLGTCGGCMHFRDGRCIERQFNTRASDVACDWYTRK